MLRFFRFRQRNGTPSPKPSRRRLALRSMGTWLVFLIFSIALLSLLPREAHGIFALMGR